jgi:hypothetical protein
MLAILGINLERMLVCCQELVIVGGFEEYNFMVIYEKNYHNWLKHKCFFTLYKQQVVETVSQGFVVVLAATVLLLLFVPRCISHMQCPFYLITISTRNL